MFALVAVVTSAGAPANAEPAVPAWQSYVLGPSSSQVAPVKVDARGSVSHAGSLVRRGPAARLTTVEGGTPASVVLDFGKKVGGTPLVDVTGVDGAPVLSLVTGEARQFLRRPSATTVAAAAVAGATSVALASTANLEVGNTVTFG